MAKREKLEEMAAKVIAERMKKGLPVADLQQALNDSKTGNSLLRTIRKYAVEK